MREEGEVGMKEFIVCAYERETIDAFESNNAQEIVRCRDCKHGKMHNIVIIECMKAHDYNPEHQEFHRKNWFCADGKRK